MPDLLEYLIYETMREQGHDDPKAARLAAESVRKALPGMGERLDRAERDRRIYELRATMSERDVAERFGVCRQRVRQIVKEQMLLIRSAQLIAS